MQVLLKKLKRYILIPFHVFVLEKKKKIYIPLVHCNEKLFKIHFLSNYMIIKINIHVENNY